MAIEKIALTRFRELSAIYPVLDVRSPGEFDHARIPGAFNLPLFSDEERKVVGTAYKQESRENAIKAGLGYFGPKMNGLIDRASEICTGWQKDRNDMPGAKPTVLVHCWRGGMRSAGVAWLLDLYGFKVYTLIGGYKSYRNQALSELARAYDFKIVGGYTGSRKTKLLHALAAAGQTIIDLEGIAKHKGSAFGGLDGQQQPSQEMFDNLLAAELVKKADSGPIWLEDESQRIGLVNLPNSFWKNIRESPVYFINVPFEERLRNIVEEYGGHDKKQLADAILRIQKRLGGLDTKNALSALNTDDLENCFRILLTYYDKHYNKALYSRENPALIIDMPANQTSRGELITALTKTTENK